MNRQGSRGVPCIAFVIAFLVGLALRGGETLFQDGRTDWIICLPSQADPTEVFAAEELHNTLRKVSGADFEVRFSDQAPEAHAIVIGSLQDPQVQSQAAALRLSPGGVEELAVHTIGGRLYLAGNLPRGALYAVYSFLQRELGVRWLWPGPDGEFVPSLSHWSLPDAKYNYRPAFAYRGFHLCGDWRDVEIFREWMARNFINIHRHAAPPEDKRRGLYSMWSSHNIRLPAALFDQHPEYFAEIGGKRYRSNLCLSHPDVDRLVAADTASYLRQRPFLDILSVFPSDNQDYCRCTRCATMDVSTAWFEFYNRLTDTLRKEFPRLKFATIAYQGYRDVPKCALRNSEFVEYASYSRCNLHPYGQAGCKHNDDTLRDLLAWQATGLPIGNYAYEYDLYASNSRFAPFLSVIADAVRTGRRLNHVSMITEIPLSPKTGPEVYAHHVQNRLSIYLYARLLWEPDRSLDDLLDDWCRTVFGEAAPPMLEYYKAMDRAWTAMPIHATILGNALNTAPQWLAAGLRAGATAAFTAAEQELPRIATPAARERAAAALRRERILFSQWEDLYRLSCNMPSLNLPLLAQPADFPRAASPPCDFAADAGAAQTHGTRVRLAWTRDALLAKWECRDPQPADLKAAAAKRDDKVTDDDSVELVLSSGATGEVWHLAVNPRGTRQDYRDSAVGVREDSWDPEWQTEARLTQHGWEAQLAILFAALGQTPGPNESWQARFIRHYGGRQGPAAAVFPLRETATLRFSSAARTDRTLLWWSGAPERESQRHAALTQEFAASGWQLQLVSRAAELAAVRTPCDAYWFRHPDGPSKVPADYWAQTLVPAVREGALVVFISYWGIPLDQYFHDPTMKLTVTECGALSLAARRSTFLAPGEWSLRPNDLRKRLEASITPAYGFVPAEPAAWTVLATAPAAGDRSYPYLLVRRYGKGLIVLGGDDIRLPPAQMLENFLLYRDSSE